MTLPSQTLAAPPHRRAVAQQLATVWRTQATGQQRSGMMERRASPAPGGRAAIQEFDRASLRVEVATSAGLLPAGSIGTVVYRYGGGRAFEVEFTTPLHAVLTLRADEIEAIG